MVPATQRLSDIAPTAVGAGSVLLSLLAWESVSRLEVLNPSSFPPASEVARALGDEMAGSELWSAVAATLESSALGLLISVAIALPLGVVLGSSAFAFRSVRIVVEFLKPVPVVAILPLALLLYGSTLQMKLLLITFGTLWPLLIQVLYGVQDVDPVLRETARSFRLGAWRRVTTLVLPSAAPMAATGLRIAAVTALVLSIVTELVGGAQGIGLEIVQAQLAASYARVYAFVIVAGVLGLAVNWAFASLERRLLAWHPSYRAVTA